MIRLPAVILAALLLVLAVPAHADAKPAPDARTVTVQYDADVPAVWPRNSLDVWEAGTRLDFVTGTCTEFARCIKVHTDTNGTACAAGVAGCAGVIGSDTLPDLHVDTCHVWLSNNLASLDLEMFFTIDPGMYKAVFAHEGGHCLGYWGHNPDPRGLMHSPVDASNPVTKPLRSERTVVAGLWG